MPVSSSPQTALSTQPTSSPQTALVWAELTVISAWIEWLQTRQRADNSRLGSDPYGQLQKEIDDAIAERERIFGRLLDNVPLAIGKD